MHSNSRYRRFMLSLVVILAPSLTSADVVRLKSGGLLRGTIKTDAKSKSDVLEVQLLSGTLVTIGKEEVAEEIRRPLKHEQYEVRLQDLEESLDAHWELAEWCRENRLLDQRRAHLERVLDFDAEHRAAHLGLGHTQQDGEWLSKEELEERKREEGFVKFNGRYVPITQLESLQAKAEQTQAEKEWFPKVKLWVGWMTGVRSDKAIEGQRSLQEIRTTDAIPALTLLMSKHAREDVRHCYVEALTKIRGQAVAVPLAQAVLREDSQTVRDLALSGFKSEHAEIARAVFIKALRDRNNLVVRRAGLGLIRVGDAHAVIPLINALVTTHSTTIQVAVPTVSARSDGKMPHPSGLPDEVVDAWRRGQFPNGFTFTPNNGSKVTRSVPVQVDVQNQEVLLALKKLTKQDFGYNEAAWQRWWNIDKAQTVIAPDLP